MSTDFKDKVSGLRLSFRWLGTDRSIESEHLHDFFEKTSSNPKAVKATKKIINPENEYLRKLNSLKSVIGTYFYGHTLPYVLKGIRLCSREKLTSLQKELEEFRAKLKSYELEFEENKQAILDDAKEYLGELFNPANYPSTFLGSFDVSWEAVNLDPPSYLMEMDPKEYERLQKLMDDRVETSLKLYDEQLGEMFLNMVNSLMENLQIGEDNKKKKLHSSAVENLNEFFTKYKEFRSGLAQSLRKDNEIDSAVDEAQKILEEFDINGIRASQKVRNSLSEKMQGIKNLLAEKIIVKAKRVVEKETAQSKVA